jgi:hypothetical protein
MLYIIATLFMLLGAGCVVLVVFSLPGTWVMIALAVLIELTDQVYLSPPPEGSQQTFSWWVLGTAFGLALLGELLEFLAGAAGTKVGGGTRRGMIGALVGGILGAFLLTPLFFWLPVLGVLLGALLGTFVGAVVGELSTEKATLSGTMKPAIGATIGRVLGTMGKLAIAIVVWLLLSVDAFWG